MHPRGFMACKWKRNWRSPILDKKSLIQWSGHDKGKVKYHLFKAAAWVGAGSVNVGFVVDWVTGQQVSHQLILFSPVNIIQTGSSSPSNPLTDKDRKAGNLPTKMTLFQKLGGIKK
jgi:hypothetical protein